MPIIDPTYLPILLLGLVGVSFLIWWLIDRLRRPPRDPEAADHADD